MCAETVAARKAQIANVLFMLRLESKSGFEDSDESNTECQPGLDSVSRNEGRKFELV